MKEIAVIFFLGLGFFAMGFLLYYSFYKKIKKKPEIGVKKENKLHYLKDGLDLIFYYKIIAIMIAGICLMIMSIVFFIVKIFK
jgi:hypothetical protein